MSTLSASPSRSIAPTALRLLGALTLLVTGAVHLQQYLGAGYRNIPTIGPLFLLNAISAGLVGLALLVRGQLLIVLAGIGIAAGALVSILISLNTPLFGFMETQTNTPVVLAIASEAATLLLLAGYLVLSRREAHARR